MRPCIQKPQRSWIPCKLHRILPLLFLLEITEILAACLPNATEASGRKNLRTGTESYPVGLWPGGGWTAAQLTSKATQIIIEDTRSCEWEGMLQVPKSL